MTPDPDDRLLVACLCAAWCHLCGDYRATFDGLAGEFGARVRFGPVLPQAQAARQLVQRALQGRLGDVLPDAALAGLRDRVQALG